MRFKTFLGDTAIANHLFLQIINITGQIILIPIFLRNYDQEIYVFWIVTSALASFLLVADSPVLQIFSVPLSKDFIDNKALNKTLIRQLIKLLIILELLIFVALTFIFIVLQYNNIAFKYSFTWMILVFFALLVANLFTVTSHYFLTVYQIVGAYKKGLNFISKGKVCELILTIFLVTLGTNLLLLIVAILFSRIATILIMKSHLHYQKNNSTVVLNKSDFLARNLLGAIASTTTVTFAIQGMLVSLSLWANEQEILLFTISRMLTVPIRIMADSLALGTFPFLLRKMHQNDNSMNFSIKTLRVYIIYLICIIPIIILSGSFVFKILTNGQVYFDFQIFMLAILSTVLDGIIAILLQREIIFSRIFYPGLSYLTLTLSQVALMISVSAFHSVAFAFILNIAGDLIMLLVIRNMKVRAT
jgi:hypothetical protein